LIHRCAINGRNDVGRFDAGSFRWTAGFDHPNLNTSRTWHICQTETSESFGALGLLSQAGRRPSEGNEK
jgi:hypothetical protein